MTYNDELKARLLGYGAPRFPEETYVISGVGEITYRGLSRADVMGQLRPQTERTRLEIERGMVSLAMVNPALTEAEVAEWQASSVAGELEHITRRIMLLSGMTVDGKPLDQEAYKSVRGES